MTRQPPWHRDDPTGVRITDVRVILTAPAGVTMVVVRVDTNEPGLFGLGCATFTQRARAVATAVTDYLAPQLIGRDPADVTDILSSLHTSGYWRSGPVLNNALSGVDMALWDIKGKQAELPVWQLLGGRCRANLALDLAAPNFGIQELHLFPDPVYEVFPGTPRPRDGHLWPSEAPGFGVDIDEAKAAAYPPVAPLANDDWTATRLPDGTTQRP